MSDEITIIHLPSVDSTNLYCERLDLSQVEAFTVVWADRQTAGIGQRGNRWHSTVGESLTFSLVLKPTWLRASSQFTLTQVLSLGVCDLLAEVGVPEADTFIKWPNDIYIQRRKVCGMLVSNRLQGQAIAVAVCGIGLNVNQERFPSELPNPTSLRMATGREYRLESLLHRLLHHIRQRYVAAERGHDLAPHYHARLLGLGHEADYILHKTQAPTATPFNTQHSSFNIKIRATITGTDPLGHLLLRTADGHPLRCALKEISPVLE